jgi:alpha-amylase
LKFLYELRGKVFETKDDSIMKDWRRLQTSDHFYYMCTKWFADGDVHKYFNPYESPYEAFISFMNAVSDLQLRAEKKLVTSVKKVK